MYSVWSHCLKRQTVLSLRRAACVLAFVTVAVRKQPGELLWSSLWQRSAMILKGQNWEWKVNSSCNLFFPVSSESQNWSCVVAFVAWPVSSAAEQAWQLKCCDRGCCWVQQAAFGALFLNPWSFSWQVEIPSDWFHPCTKEKWEEQQFRRWIQQHQCR